MKKTFKILACAAAFATAFCACTKDNGGNGGEIIGGDGDENGGTPTETVASLSGSDYAVILLDETTTAKLGDKVACNLGVDNDNINCWDWAGAYTGGTCAGVNFYGEAAEWFNWVVSSAVSSIYWSGGGFNIADPSKCAGLDAWRTRVAADPSSYYLHFAYKASKAGEAHLVSLVWGSTSYAFGLGGSYTDNGNTYSELKPLSGSVEVGEWNEYEISIADTGVNYGADAPEDGTNFLTVLSGGTEGANIQLDAVFIYKK